MQVVCDNNRKIRDIFIGYPGSVHDARVLRNSPLFDTLAEKCGDNYILGDSAYPCLRHLLTPYKDTGRLTAVEKNFNKRLSHCRVIVEHTIGILKQKFRQLYHIKIRNIDTICHIIRACCVLHNLALEDDEDVNVETTDNFVEQFEDILVDEENNDSPTGNRFRNYIAALINT